MYKRQDRDSKITLFRKEKYHHVRLTLGGAEAVSEKIAAPEEAEALRAVSYTHLDVYKRQIPSRAMGCCSSTM